MTMIPETKKTSLKWNDKLIISELLNLTKSLGEFPSMTKLKEIQRFDLRSAIRRHGGIIKFRELTGYKLACKPRNFWNKSIAEKEFSKIVNELGRCPFSIELTKLNPGLQDYVYRNGLYPKLRKKFEYKPIIKPSKFWKKWDNVLNCLMLDFGKLISNGIFPTRTMMLKSPNCRSVIDAIQKYHGGFKKVAANLNCITKNNMVAPDGHFVDSTYEIVFDWYLWSRGIKHEVHGLISPNFRYRFDFKVQDIYFEIWGLDNEKYMNKRIKKENLYQELKLNLISIEKELFEQNVAGIEKSLDMLFQSLNIKTTKNVKSFDIQNFVNNKGYWNFNNTLAELKLAIKQLGKFPTIKDLKTIKKSKLIKPIYKHGGLSFFKKELGYSVDSHPRGYWSQKKIIEEIKELKNKLNYFPSTLEVRKHDPKLLDAIFRNGGITLYKKLCG